MGAQTESEILRDLLRDLDARAEREGWAIRTPRGRAGLRGGLWRDAFDVGEAERYVREAAAAHARMEASGAPRDDRALVELRVLVAEVARRAQAIREAGRG